MATETGEAREAMTEAGGWAMRAGSALQATRRRE